MLADFVVSKAGSPRLSNIRVVGPAYGVYETQQWAPDGSGFLFTAFGPRNSPYQATPPGWMHQELYFMRLYGPGVSPAKPRVTLITDDLPVYQEQAVFTPDMRDVVFMTNRNASDGSWYDAVIAAARPTTFDAPLAGSAGTPQFLADFTDPNFRSDLYMVDVTTHDLRELTHFTSDIIPEFNWNRDHTDLLWSAEVAGTGRFRTAGRRLRRRDLRRSHHSPARSSGRAGRTAHRHGPRPPVTFRRKAGRPHQQRRRSCDQPVRRRLTSATPALPPVTLTDGTLWLAQLAQLGAVPGASSHPPIS